MVASAAEGAGIHGWNGSLCYTKDISTAQSSSGKALGHGKRSAAVRAEDTGGVPAADNLVEPLLRGTAQAMSMTKGQIVVVGGVEDMGAIKKRWPVFVFWIE